MLAYLLLIIYAPLTISAAPDADAVIAALQKKYETVTDFKAAFEQKLEKKDVLMTFERSGTVYFKKPGLMRWDYKLPERMYYIADGTHLYQYKPEDNMVYKMGIKNSQVSQPFKVLFGIGKIKEDFNVSAFKVAGKSYALTFTPKQVQAAYKSFTITATGDTWDVTGITIVDPLGNENAITFKKITYKKLPDKGFKLNIPKGVQVKDLSK